MEPQSRKIVFKTAVAFGESDYDIFPVKNETARLRLVSMIQIRDTLRELLNTEKSADADEGRMATLRQRLNSQYDTFVKKYGHLNSQTNRGLMRSDPEHSLLESLELDYDKGLSPETARKHGGEARPASAKKPPFSARGYSSPPRSWNMRKPSRMPCLLPCGKRQSGFQPYVAALAPSG